ncbi:MAG: hypothetical protein ACLFO1_06890 [Spirochaetaceae bacterium]
MKSRNGRRSTSRSDPARRARGGYHVAEGARPAVVALLWLWQLPQHLLGLVLLVALRAAGFGTTRYRRARVVLVPGNVGLSLGHFIFISRRHRTPDLRGNDTLLRHEYGHTIQSHMLGWLYLPLVGVPSIVQAAFSFAAARLGYPGPGRRYYRRFPENWADRLGGVDRSPRRH